MRLARTQPSACANRRGFTLLEMVGSALLLAMAMTLTVQMLGWAGIERRASGRRERALQEAANLMERFTARPWNALNDQTAAALALSAEARDALPGAILSVKVSTEPGEPAARRVSIEIRWHDRSGSPDAPVRLTAWVYHRPEATP